MFGLAASTSSAVVGVARREQHLAELRGDALGERAVDRPVEADDAAERRLRVAREGALVGLERRAADRRRRTGCCA